MTNEKKDLPQKTSGRQWMVSAAIAAVILAVLWIVRASTDAALTGGKATPGETALSEVEALGAFEPHTQTALYRILAERYLIVRDGPSSESNEIGRLSPGAEVRVLDWVGSYYRVRDDNTGLEGFVVGGYLQPTQKDAFLAEPGIVDVSTQAYGYEEMIEDLAELQSAYPELMHLTSIVVSLDGREIPVAVVGNPAAQYHFLIQASIHAREYLCTLLVMKQMEYFLSQYQSGAYDGDEYAALKNVAFHIIPMANPDGVTISIEGPEGIRDDALREGLYVIYERDTAAGLTDLPADRYFVKWKANARGVNLNLNFDAGWADLDSSDGPSASAYAGAAAESEPETRALIAYTLRYDFAGTISYHAYGSGYYWDFGQRGALRERTKSLAWLIQSVSGYISLDDLMGEPSAGGYKDWALDALGIPSLTVEIGTTSCPVNIREFPTVWERNRQVWAVAAQWAVGG